MRVLTEEDRTFLDENGDLVVKQTVPRPACDTRLAYSPAESFLEADILDCVPDP